MTIQHVLAPAICIADDEPGLLAAAELARKNAAHATALIVAVHLASSFAEEQRPLSEVLDDFAKGGASKAAREKQDILDWLKRSGHDYSVRELAIEGAVDRDEIVAHARFAELIVLTRAQSYVRARRALLEDVLLKSARPVLLAPDKPRARSWDRYLVGWSATAEAMRAVIAALPLLRAAKQVVVATVDAMPSPSGHGQAPGRDLGAYLAARGVDVEVRNLDGLGRSVSQALVDEAAAIDADALIVGAYGHSRAREFLFGGTTRDLIAGAPLPVLLAH